MFHNVITRASMSLFTKLVFVLSLIVGLSAQALAQGDVDSLRPLVNELAEGKFAETEQQIGAKA